jgi:transposase
VIGVIMDQDGQPVCCEMWPGNTADVATLIPVINPLRRRFGIRRICVVAAETKRLFPERCQTPV